MVFADKLIMLRKKQGWSQEELAEMMDVSRQAVSKWESAQALPDIDKIVALSVLFSVTTDYLLKDSRGDELCTDGAQPASRILTLPEAERYVAWRRVASILIALGTFLCIVSVIPLLILPITAVSTALGISDEVAGIIGIVSLFVTVAIGVCIFVITGIRNGEYAYLEEKFIVSHSAKELLSERLAASRFSYILFNAIGVAVCILSPLCVVLPALLGAEEKLGFAIPATVFAVAVAVVLFIISGVRRASLMRLLSQGEYSCSGKKSTRIKEAVDSVYWSIALAVYLGWSFLSGAWGITWVVWPVAGVLSAALSAVYAVIDRKSEEDN